MLFSMCACGAIFFQIFLHMSKKSSTFAAEMTKMHYIVFGLIICGFLSCSYQKKEEARHVVAEADSLSAIKQTYGLKDGDSIRLAEACEELRVWQWLYKSEYAHGCFHYGRLLRKKEDPVGAMRTFINASHVHPRDHLILARVYSNMGSICNDAEDYQLSHDMYRLTARYYLRAGDTLKYYEATQLQALALGNQGLTEEAVCLLEKIKNSCANTRMQQELLSTKSLVYLHIHQYDSAIYYMKANMLFGKTDSAEIKSISDTFAFLESLQVEQANAQNGKAATGDWNALMNLIAGQFKMTNIASDASKELSVQAVQLLRNDIHRQKTFAWIYGILITLLFAGIIIVWYYNHQANRHALLSQKISDAELEYSDLQNNKKAQLEATCEVLRDSDTLEKDLCWRNYGKMCEKADELFYLFASKLKQKQVLNESEVRLCVLILIGLSHDQIAVTLPYARNSVGKLKDQTAKKLGTIGRNLHDFLLDLALKA